MERPRERLEWIQMARKEAGVPDSMREESGRMRIRKKAGQQNDHLTVWK